LGNKDIHPGTTRFGAIFARLCYTRRTLLDFLDAWIAIHKRLLHVGCEDFLLVSPKLVLFPIAIPIPFTTEDCSS